MPHYNLAGAGEGDGIAREGQTSLGPPPTKLRDYKMPRPTFTLIPH